MMEEVQIERSRLNCQYLVVSSSLCMHVAPHSSIAHCNIVADIPIGSCRRLAHSAG